MASPEAMNKSAVDNSGDDKRVILTLLAMTLVTGFVDAVSYLGPGHVFTANMTGNVALLGFAMAGAPRLSVSRSLASLAAFVLGGVLGGRVASTFSTTTRHSWLVRVAWVEAALLLAAALTAININASSVASGSRTYGVIVLTAVAMGFRTAAVRRLAEADVRTTVLTSTLAALAGDSFLGGGNNRHMGRRTGSVLVMLIGAAIGALLLRFSMALPLVLGAVVVLGVTWACGSLPSRAAITDEK
jgi:uncharacterized membrane protein YoaK (UPF0700 family)